MRQSGVTTVPETAPGCDAGRMGPIEFTPLSDGTLAVAAPWFEDEQTQRWLGGPGWPALVLRLAADPSAEHRGPPGDRAILLAGARGADAHRPG